MGTRSPVRSLLGGVASRTFPASLSLALGAPPPLKDPYPSPSLFFFFCFFSFLRRLLSLSPLPLPTSLVLPVHGARITPVQDGRSPTLTDDAERTTKLFCRWPSARPSSALVASRSACLRMPPCLRFRISIHMHMHLNSIFDHSNMDTRDRSSQTCADHEAEAGCSCRTPLLSKVETAETRV